MSQRRYQTIVAGCVTACAASWALSAHAQEDTFGGYPGTNALIRIPANTDDWTRHFRVGGVAGMNIKANFSINGNNLGINGSNPGAGIFNDGYVQKDQSGDTVYTSNWGYDSPSQLYTAGGQHFLRMEAANSFSTTGDSSSESGFLPGLDIAYGGNLWYWRHARIGWDVGFSWLPIDIGDNSPLYGTVSETTYNFNVGNIVVPTAPYHGTSGGVGPLIPLQGTRGSATTASAVVTGSHALEVQLYTFRLGPTIFWDLSRRTSLSLGAGPAIGVVNGEYKYDETIIANGVPAENSGSIHGTDAVYGGYVNATLLYHWEDHGDFYIGAQFMPMSDATISGGGREGQLDLSGQIYLSVGINWPF